MASDDPIEPVTFDAPPSVAAVQASRAAPISETTPTQAAPPTRDLADALERSLILEGGGVRDEPTGVATRADLHDAAVHGDTYARAVADAQAHPNAAAADPNSIGQVLGGAAAAAHSGQAARMQRTPEPGDTGSEQVDGLTHELDPLAPVPRVTDSDEEDRRRRQRDDAAR